VTARRLREPPEHKPAPQCSCTSIEWMGWSKHYVERRTRKILRRGWKLDQCGQYAAYEIDGKLYCPSHAGSVALKKLLEE